MVNIGFLIDLIKQQLLPYRHPKDIGSAERRWSVEDSDYLRDWLLEALKSCYRRNKCEKRGKCVHYEYSDQARANYRICKEFILLMENGSITVKPTISKDEGMAE